MFIEFEQWGTQNEPRIRLPEGPFVHGCQVSKKAKGYALHGFFTGGEHLTNDMNNGPNHLPDIPYDMSPHVNVST